MIFGLDINKIFFWNILNFIEKFQKEINHLQIFNYLELFFRMNMNLFSKNKNQTIINSISFDFFVNVLIIFFYIFMRGNFFKLIFENICLCILLIFNKKEKKKKLIEPYEF